MAETAIGSAHYLQKWASEVFTEFQREVPFYAFTGEGMDNIICTKRELLNSGRTMNLPFFPDLTGDGVAGNGILEGSEEAMVAHNETITVDYLRTATLFTERDVSFVNFDLAKASRTQIKNWAKNKARLRIINQLLSVRASGTGDNLYYGKITDSSNGPVILAANSAGASVNIDGVTVTTASEANKDTWITNNADRVVAGLLASNVSGDHSTTLATLDTTDDTMRYDIVMRAKRMAEQSSPRIHPYKVDGDQNEWYVMFCGTRAFRDAERDPTIVAADREARTRDAGALKNNPIFTGGELLVRGVIIKKIPELPVLYQVGASSADVAVSFLCGRQALGYALGGDMKAIEDTRDYQFRRSLGVSMFDAYKKLFFNNKQHGVVTVYTAAAADA